MEEALTEKSVLNIRKWVFFSMKLVFFCQIHYVTTTQPLTVSEEIATVSAATFARVEAYA